MKILVAGGGGFLGSRIARALKAGGQDPVVLGRNDYPELKAEGIRCVRGDIRQPSDVRRALEGGVRSVFHVAAKVGYWGRYKDFRSVNVDGTRTLLSVCRQNEVRRFVYTSSPSVVIGLDGAQGFDESAPYVRGRSYPYGATKAEGERLVLGANSDDFRTVALRPHFIFGPGDPHITPRLIQRAQQGKLIQVGRGNNHIDVTYIDNAVRAHLDVHEALSWNPCPVGGQAYFIGQEEPVALWSFVRRILEGFGVPPVKKTISYRTARFLGAAMEFTYRFLRISREPPLTRMAAVILGTSHAFSHKKAQRDFGYSPEVTLDKGLAQLFAQDAAAHILAGARNQPGGSVMGAHRNAGAT